MIRKYAMQCEELINRSKEQYNEIKTLRKDNVNMHKEHNRLQVTTNYKASLVFSFFKGTYVGGGGISVPFLQPKFSWNPNHLRH